MLTGDDRERSKAARIVFLTRGDPAKDSYFQQFSDAFQSRHATLSRRVKLEALSVTDDFDEMERLLRHAAQMQPILIVAQNGTQARITRKAAPDIPLVFSSHSSPLELGIASALLKRPEPATGLWVNDDLDAKRLELLLDAYPSLRTVAVLGDTEWFDELGERRSELASIARARGVALHIQRAESVDEALRLVNAPGSAAVQAWCLPRTTLSMDSRVGRLIASQGKPVMAGHTPDVYETATLSYAYDRSFIAPALADLAARVVQGEPAGAIPIQVPQRFQLAIRMVSDPRLPALNSDVVKRADLVIR